MKMPIHQMLRMARGAVIELDATEDDEVQIQANGMPIARGQVVINGNRITKERIVLRTVWRTGCLYEWTHHVHLARKAGVPMEPIPFGGSGMMMPQLIGGQLSAGVTGEPFDFDCHPVAARRADFQNRGRTAVEVERERGLPQLAKLHAASTI